MMILLFHPLANLYAQSKQTTLVSFRASLRELASHPQSQQKSYLARSFVLQEKKDAAWLSPHIRMLSKTTDRHSMLEFTLGQTLGLPGKHKLKRQIAKSRAQAYGFDHRHTTVMLQA
ncbi:MAG: hypothetical protein OXC40_04080, partial [Proteobacteria bacterium]|nr:hypothetical protein [Pseudomonadota bacterium]